MAKKRLYLPKKRAWEIRGEKVNLLAKKTNPSFAFFKMGLQCILNIPFGYDYPRVAP